jgi:hypothetical protein
MKKTSQQSQRNTIGARIRKTRLARNPPVSQEDLAGRLAVKGVVLDQTAISRWITKSRPLPVRLKFLSDSFLANQAFLKIVNYQHPFVSGWPVFCLNTASRCLDLNCAFWGVIGTCAERHGKISQ